MRGFRKTSYTHNEKWDGRHRFEHWYRDNSGYFITSKVRDGLALHSRRAASDASVRYTLNQAVKARVVKDWKDYSDTRVFIERDRAVKRAVELKAFMEKLPYARYERKKKRRGQRS